MKRKDCFFGLHFDFHPNKETSDIGKNFDPELLEKIICEVKPDFVQCDAKGHNSCSSYRTKVGVQAPHLCKDLLAEWREITGRHNIPLYCHCSGLWAIGTSEQHPEWAAYNADGTRTVKMSVFGDYDDELLIPQLKEIARDYKLNGVWIDGECWAQVIDYSEKAKKLFEEETGLKVDELSEADMPKWMEFHRKGFLRHVEHYVTEVKKECPDFEITSNYLNTSWVPDYFNVTDYISGDLTPTNAVDCARFDARIIQAFGRNWDLMSWGISAPVHHVKSAVQLEQEAAVVIALGGAYHVYNMQSPQNTVHDEWAIPMWKELGEFVRSRKEFCHQAEVVPDVGVVYSAKAYYACMNNAIFYRDNDYNNELNGVLMSLCDTGRNVSVVLAERFNEINLSEYNTLVVTDFEELEHGAKEKLLTYAAQGGNLLIIGANSSRIFAHSIGVETKDGKEPVVMLKADGASAEVRRPYIHLLNVPVQNVMDEYYPEGDLVHHDPPPTIAFKQSIPSFTVNEYGQGTVAFVPISYGTVYLNDRAWELKRFINNCISYLGEGIATVNKGGLVELLVSRKGSKRYVHLINLQGEHRSQFVKTFEEIPPVLDVTVDIALEKQPKAVKLQPGNVKIGYTKTDTGIRVQINRIDIHTIIEIEE